METERSDKGLYTWTQRECLMCGKKFSSWGPGHRRCNNCQCAMDQEESYYGRQGFK